MAKDISKQNAGAEFRLMTLLSIRPKLVKRAMPTDPVYDVEAIMTPRRATRPKMIQPKPVSEKSMFFRFRGGNLDQDPFLQRLSRLN